MKNLFAYATKELSQDAFLRWLFENYNCENESVRLASRRLFESFTGLNIDTITELHTQAQWHNIDIVVRFKAGDEAHLISIEDKTESEEHNQLANYNMQLAKSEIPNVNIHKVYYKTNIVTASERTRVEAQGWRIYDIYEIAPLFKGLQSTSEVLSYYVDSLVTTLTDANRLNYPNTWNLTSWHSFFNDYLSAEGISSHKEIACYQKAYYYLKLFVKDHEFDMPCLEIRSRDFTEVEGRYKLTVRVVLYNVQGQVSKEQIESWQAVLKDSGMDFIPSYRSDVSKHKQIGKFSRVVENSESSLKEVLNELSQALVQY